MHIDWGGFRGWLLETHSGEWAGRLFGAARKYCGVLSVPGEASHLSVLPPSTQKLAMAALSNLSKYLGVYKVWKGIIENAGLKWSNGRSEDLVLGRLTRVQNPRDIINWVREVKSVKSELAVFTDFVAATGLRFVEAVNAYNLIIDLSRKDMLNEYYDVDHALLQHYKHKDMFLRRSKKVFVSFTSPKLVNQIEGCKPISEVAIQSRLKKAGLTQKFGDLREYWATIMTKRLKQPEIDFLQGRVSTSVFMKHYFNPAWITDLKERTLKTSQEILTKIN